MHEMAQAQEREQREQLARVRTLATGLLLLMAVLFVFARTALVEYPWAPYLSAFSEAAMVGALADWFAVTALFRHPLGLPIPHTAIIPANKDRIGASVANFLEHNFMTREVLAEELGQIDFVGAAGRWMTHPGNSRDLAQQLVAGLPALIRMVEDEDIANLVQSSAGQALAGLPLAPVLGEIVAVLIADRRHQQVFDRMLDMAADALENNRPLIRQKIHEKSPRWLPRLIDDKLFDKLLQESQNTIEEMRAADSPWRLQFQQAAENLADHLRHSPDYERRIRNAVTQTVHHPLFRSYSEQLWHTLRERLLADAALENSALAARLERVIRSIGEALMQDPVVQQKLNLWVRSFATEAIAARRQLIAGLIRRVIEKWDAETVSRKFELYVGRDLQYIRINGTLVGGMVGLLLHLLSQVI